MTKQNHEQTTIGSRIRQLRMEAGMTQEELAEQLHLEGKTAISKYEGGTRGISAEMAVRLSEIFGVSTDYILKGQEDQDDYLARALALLKRLHTNAGKDTALRQLQALADMESILNR